MDVLLEQIIRSPKAERYAEQLQAILADEKRRRGEFLSHLTEDDKAEFINGQVVCHSPVRFAHVQVTHWVLDLLRAFVRARDLGFVGAEKMLVSLTRNDYEPDICFWKREKAQAFTPDQLRFPAPDLIVEVISESTEAIDRGVKFEDYATHGVGEYWIIDPERQTIEQYTLRGEQYELLYKMSSGTLCSPAVTGFSVPVRALFDEQENRATVEAISAG